MFSCLWHLWDWFDPTSMENKKRAYTNTGGTPNSDSQVNETVLNHVHQHNTAPQHLRLLQYGLKIPNHQHAQLNQSSSHQHQLTHLIPQHQHSSQSSYQYHSNTPTVYQNQLILHQQYPHQQYPHQHQQKYQNHHETFQNDNHYHYQSIPPQANVHTHNLNHQNAHIWVPHRPPEHYHPQQQPSHKSEPHTIPYPVAPHVQKAKETDRKKFSINQQLRSPSAKRPLEAPVKLQGWLHKQGSDGLMLWKRRWFVLSEYCLFYYKGPEEGKVLGSILLPSYKVSVCEPNDKVNRKFAFKCEHANMRTYILAADSHDLMLQWVNLLNMACLLQNSNETEQNNTQLSSISKIESSVIELRQPNQPQNIRSTPIHVHTSSNTTDLSNPSQQELSQYLQPLYANAPPKPRRLTDGYASPSSEVLDRNSSEPKYIALQPSYQYNMKPTYFPHETLKSPINVYRNVHHKQVDQQSYQQICNKHLHIPEYAAIKDKQNLERRTPDTYGRSKLNTPKGNHFSDYEDIHTEQYMYKRPLSPLSYTNSKLNPALNVSTVRPYTPLTMQGPTDNSLSSPGQQCKKNSNIVQRPHSADFLDYEVKHQNSKVISKQPRPKSSLDINRNTSNDNYFYSEQYYAEKMRKSAQYLPNISKYSNSQSEYAPSPQQQWPPVYNKSEAENTYPLMRSNTQPVNSHSSNLHEFFPGDLQPSRSRSVLSDGSLSKEMDLDMHSRAHEHFRNEVSSPAFQSKQEQVYRYEEDLRRQSRDYDQFTRSASARLPQTSSHPDSRPASRDGGERKREESMKRLLEWKQRMLQSPLNRKINPGMAKGFYNKYNPYYGTPENGYCTMPNFDVYPESSRYKTATPQYNSYSSDDEEKEDGSKENVQTQAGWTIDTVSSISEPLAPALIVSTTACNFQPPSSTVHNNMFCSATDSTLPDACTNICEIISSQRTISENNTNSMFELPLKVFAKQSTPTALVSSLRSEYSSKFELKSATESKSNNAIIKNIFQKHVDTESTSCIQPPLEEDSLKDNPFSIKLANEHIPEQNYMIMTPKKSILEPRHSNSSFELIPSPALDENPYVEMTLGCNMSLLDPHDNTTHELQTYETVSFSNGNIEPVYVELNYFAEEDCIKGILDDSKSKLPDILGASHDQNSNELSNKSDSSDADDEASKDLDSLEIPSHPRFSLSDTFRPASYYLGANSSVPEHQDSSDSELVSPPPIPTSSPPLDDMDIMDEITSVSQDTSLNLRENKKGVYTLKSHCLYDSHIAFLEAKMPDSLNTSLELDHLSSYSINTDLDRTYSSRLSHNSDSDIEFRSNLSRVSHFDSILKRRPLSEEFHGNLDSLSFNETSSNITFDQMGNDNSKYCSSSSIVNSKQISRQMMDNYHDYENMHISPEINLPEYSKNSLNIKGSQIICENIEELAPAHSYSRDNSRDTVKSGINSCRSTHFTDFVLREYPRGDSSITDEAAEYLVSSGPNLITPIRSGSSMSITQINCSSPFLCENNLQQSALNSFDSQPAPYYYSDLPLNNSCSESNSSILTLNNQRSEMVGSKRDITHIVNPIRCNNRLMNAVQVPYPNLFDTSSKLAAEARSVSVDFLNIADKSGNIDKKNIYESDTLKRLKMADSLSRLQLKSDVRNLYPINKGDKFSTMDTASSLHVRRSYSLEGLLENVFNETVVPQTSGHVTSPVNESSHITMEGSYLWEEDSIWHERLRTASQRHTRSLDDLDSINEFDKKCRKQPRGITRLVTYVNDNMFNMPLEDKHQIETEDKQEKDKNGTRESNNFTIDREKLRQWDFLSSAPSDVQLSQSTQASIGSVVDLGAGLSVCEPSEQCDLQHSASGSISIAIRDTVPRSAPSKKLWTPSARPVASKSPANTIKSYENTGSHTPQQAYISHGRSQQDLSSDTSQSSNSYRVTWQFGDRMNVSAGELLGRTHEELILLLIQLRRQSANTCNAIEAYYTEIETIQSGLPKMDASKRLENLQKLEQIKQHLLELEKQYEKGKPLVNLVDNMVKLGSLYRFPKGQNSNLFVKNRLEFNQHIQERRLLAEERRDWNRLSPNHTLLQSKVQQLYQLDRLIQEESQTLHGLQQDKEEIERALSGLRQRLMKGFKDPEEIEQARKQQSMLENELSRVHSMLAQNSRKLEETVAGNARLEQELLVLKQKLQITKQQRSSPQTSNAGDSLPCVIGTSAMLESDLHRVQQKVGDLQRQRQELSMQVRQLTDRSSNMQQLRVSSINPFLLSQPNKRKNTTLWRETDLDTMNSTEYGDSVDSFATTPIPLSPLYINTNIKQNHESDIYGHSLKSSDSASDDTLYNQIALPQEKQEIKTVRIVKRESERRQRDREKTTPGKWDTVIEEEDAHNSSGRYHPPSGTVVDISPSISELDNSSGNLSRENSVSNQTLHPNYGSKTSLNDETSGLSPIFKSEAAKQIINEMSTKDVPKQTNRRAVPKEKRRHYTAPHNNLIMKSLTQLPIDDKDFDRLDVHIGRARDDLDMERALRQQIDAPDVVRSTLSNKELKYNESTIDNIFGTPNKIFIPERYIPEQLPQLSAEEQQHRLRKVESIKKMLSDTTIISGSNANLASEEADSESASSGLTNKNTSKMLEEKKQREHLLQLNQILAKQVMEMSKIVAVKALASLPLKPDSLSSDEENFSPDTHLPIYQQRDNFYS